MARPMKWRKVCCLPERSKFGPLDSEPAPPEPIVMTIDEYEAVRLIDFEDFTQEECAEQMGVARSTVQGIYAQARKRSPKPWSTAGCCSSKVASTSSAKAQETDAAEDVTDVGRKETIEVVGRCVSVELEQSVCGNGQME